VKVVDASHMDKDEIQKYSDDMAAFLDVLNGTKKEEQEIGNVVYHPETLMAIGAVTGQKKYIKMAEEFGKDKFEKGVTDMDMLDYVEEKEREKGIRTTISILLDLDTEYTVILKQLEMKYQLSSEKAERYLKEGIKENAK